MNKKDINWINALKALCIIFVFLRHSGNYYGVGLGWFDGIYLPFYVNAFFFVSGYLLFWKQLSAPKIDETRDIYVIGGGKTLAFNVLFRIVIPSIIFSIIEFFPKKLIKGDEVIASDCFFETLGGCTYWFTSALVVAELLFLLLLFTRRRSIWFYAIPAFLLSALGAWLSKSGFYFIEGHGSFPWQYKHGLICMAYLAMGGIYKWKVESLEWSVSTKVKNIGLLLLTAIYIAGSVLFKDTLYNGYMTSMGYITPVGALWSLLASILLIELCKRLPKIGALTFIGQNSLGFYFLSGALPITFGMIANKLLISGSTLMMLAIWITCVLVAYVAVLIINRWLPWLWDLRLLRGESPVMTNSQK